MKSKYAFICPVACLALLHGIVALAGFFAPYDYAYQDRDVPFAPPTRIHFVDSGGRFHLRPFVYRLREKPEEVRVYEEDKSAAYPLHLFPKGSVDAMAGHAQSERHLFGVDRPGRVFLMGTDGYGRDVFSRVLFAGRVSLFSGFLATVLTLSLGTLLGVLAGFYGSWPDAVIMRFAELFLALPWLYLLFALRAFLPLHISPEQAFLLLIGVIGFVGWARPARLIRGIVLSAKERGYVLAARGFGASDGYLLLRHILPEANGVVCTQAALLIPRYILAEVTLSFLGLGVGEPLPSWGNMLANLQQYHVLVSYWWMFFPGLILVPIFLSYGALSSALQEKFA